MTKITNITGISLCEICSFSLISPKTCVQMKENDVWHFRSLYSIFENHGSKDKCTVSIQIYPPEGVKNTFFWFDAFFGIKFEKNYQISTQKPIFNNFWKFHSDPRILRFHLKFIRNRIWSTVVFLYGHRQNFAFPHHNPHFPADNPIGITEAFVFRSQKMIIFLS